MVKLLFLLRNGTPYYMKINSMLTEDIYVKGFYRIIQKKIFVALRYSRVFKNKMLKVLMMNEK